MSLINNTETLRHYDDNIELPFELLKQKLDNSTGYVRARAIRNIVKKMHSLNYDGKFIHDYISRLKGIPPISKKHDSKDNLTKYSPKEAKNQSADEGNYIDTFRQRKIPKEFSIKFWSR